MHIATKLYNLNQKKKLSPTLPYQEDRFKTQLHKLDSTNPK